MAVVTVERDLDADRVDRAALTAPSDHELLAWRDLELQCITAPEREHRLGHPFIGRVRDVAQRQPRRMALVRTVRGRDAFVRTEVDEADLDQPIENSRL